MEHIQKGPCCVCGVTTTQRCSSCANHGLNLFLCGREHQKLIWYAHKKVCGVNSNPFRFPPLTPEEISTATARRSEDPLHSASLSGTLCGRYEWMKDSDLPALLKSLGREGRHPTFPAADVSELRAMTRSHLYMLALDVLGNDSQISASRLAATDYNAQRKTAFVACQVALAHRFDNPEAPLPITDLDIYFLPFDDKDGVYLYFHHLVLVHSAIMQRIAEEAERGSLKGTHGQSLLQYSVQCRAQVARIVDETALVNQVAARHMRSALRQLGEMAFV